jgi:hypothetical protein
VVPVRIEPSSSASAAENEADRYSGTAFGRWLTTGGVVAARTARVAKPRLGRSGGFIARWP